MSYRNMSVTSADGTTIAYREFGRGPGIVLVHGGLQAAQNFTKLAEVLADSFTVCVPDRRGRGRSGPFGPAYGLATESADLEAVLRQSGARCVFGLSSGALIALHAACTIAGIEKLAIYEPPLATPHNDPTTWGARYEREMGASRIAAAMVSVIKGTGDVAMITYVPRLILEPLMWLAIREDAKRPPGGDDVAIGELVPTLRFDLKLAREARTAFVSLEAMRSEVLLLGGNRSARSLRVALDDLAGRLPNAKRVELTGIGHLAADNHGRPLEVAEILSEFFG
jgi:pimeloyl-ACP methyl ester carboxylesterase